MTGLDPGSDEWLKYMTASKVAAVMGYSPYCSPLTLWARMKGLVPQELDRQEMARGHFLEPAIITWFFSQHPELRYVRPRTFYREDLFAANPDALALTTEEEVSTATPLRALVTPVEAKSTNDLTEWGQPGTDEIPPHYALQCVWTMFVMDADRIYVPMIGPFLQFEEYVVLRDRKLETAVVERCRGFMESLKGDVPPPLSPDARHWVEEYETMRVVHPDIDKSKTVEIPADLAVACIGSRGSEEHAKAQLMELMGDAATARCNGYIIARRTSRMGGKPYVAWPKKPIDPQLLES